MTFRQDGLAGLGIALLVASLTAYFIYTKFHLIPSQGHEYGVCRRPPAYRHKEPLFGLDSFRDSIRASKVHKSLEREQDLHKRYGSTFTSKFLGSTMINTIDPENLKTVLSTNFEHFGVGSRRKTAFRPLLGDSIFQRDGPEWESSKDLLRPCFSRLTTTAIEKVERHVQDLIQVISEAPSVVDLGPLFERLAADIASDLIFGDAVNSFQDPHALAADVMNAIHDSQSACELRWLLGPFANLVPQPAFYRNVQIVHKYVQHQIEKASKDFKQTSPEDNTSLSSTQPKSFLAHLAMTVKDPRRLLDEVLTVYFAGSDPSAALWTNLFFELAKQPDLWRRLAHEVQFLNGQPPSINQVKALRLTNWCVLESKTALPTCFLVLADFAGLRLHPPQASNSRVAEQDTTLPRGGGEDGSFPVFVRKGQMVHWSTYGLHRDENLWGADAGLFNPDRWSKEPPSWVCSPPL